MRQPSKLFLRWLQPFSVPLQDRIVALRRLAGIAVLLLLAGASVRLEAACTLTCAGARPPTAFVGDVVPFTASSTAVGCIGTPTYSWSFGDGTFLSTANPTHTYSWPGLYSLSLTVSISPATSCSLEGTIAVLYTPLPGDDVVVSTIAGTPGTAGTADGLGPAARFSDVNDVAVDPNGNILVADFSNTIRKIAPSGYVSTFAGQATFGAFADGAGSSARFHDPSALAVDRQGYLYVADRFNYVIRKVSPSGVVTTLAGKPLTSGSADGQGSEARFLWPEGIAVDDSGNVFVSDTGNHTIRRITPDGSVRTMAGKAGVTGTTDGPANEARFYNPGRLALDRFQNLYITENSGGAARIRCLSAAGAVRTIATSTMNMGNMGTYFEGIAVDGAGNLIVADWGSNALLKITPEGSVRVLAGLPGSVGSTDGAGVNARFNIPSGVAMSSSGDMYVADLSNHTVRSVTSTALRVQPSATPSLAAVGVPITFSAGASRGTAPYTYAWTFSDGLGATSVANPVRTFAVPGTYTAATTVTDKGGMTATGTVAFTVLSELAVSPSATPNPSIVGSPISFSAGVSGGIPPVTYSWTFSDGQGATSAVNPTRAFSLAGNYTATVAITDGVGMGATGSVAFSVVAGDRDFTTLTRTVPIVLDVTTAIAHYSTELTLTNRGATPVSATLRYQASLGSQQGSGAIAETLRAGEQRVIPNVLSYLKSRGLNLPTTDSQPQQGGVLIVKFQGADSEASVAATARTTTATLSPQPVGAAGLAYGGLQPGSAAAGSATIYGMRQTDTDRSNVAVFNLSPDPVTVRVTAFAGDASGYSSVVKDAETLPGFGWVQYNAVLQNTGITQGWVAVEKTGGSGSFSAYGVINDNVTSDGSYVAPTTGTISGSRLTVPVLVETSAFRSELVLANRSSATATLTLRYVESQTPSLGAGGTTTVTLRPKEQLILPQATDWLRSKGIQIGARDVASYVGALRITVSGAALSDVYAGARTASPSPAGGQFGLFTPGVYEGQEASTEAYLYGLRADVNNRSNVAVENSGADGSGSITLELRAFDGDVGGAERGSPQQVVLPPGQFKQFNNILAAAGIQNGWIRVRRLAGAAPWITYGVINDGGNPGERTGDGAYLPMIATIQ